MVAARLSDVVVITSDNPRSEDPARIIDEVKRGAEPETRQRGAEVLTIVDRRDAILQAVDQAEAGRCRADRRQGTREVPGDRRRDAAVRRRGGGAGGAGGAAPQVAGWVSRHRRVLDRCDGWRRGGRRAITDGDRGRRDRQRRHRQPHAAARRLLRRAARDRGSTGTTSSARRSTRGQSARSSSGVRRVRFEDPAHEVGRVRRSRPARGGRSRTTRRRRCRTWRTRCGRRAGRGSSRSRAARARRRRRKRSRSFSRARLRVVKNKGNLNNHIGLPLSLMQLRERPDVAVMELGMNHAGEISTLVAIAEPDARVDERRRRAPRLLRLAGRDCRRQGGDSRARDADHVLVCNADDPRVMARAAAFAGRTMTFGTSAGATVRARRRRGPRHRRHARARDHAGRRARRFETPLLGRGNLSNVLAATAVALDFGVPLDDIVAAAARLQPADRRGAVRRLRDGIVLIDDSYNSSPAALAAALEVVGREPRVVAEGRGARRDARARRALAGAAPRVRAGRRGRGPAAAVRHRRRAGAGAGRRRDRGRHAGVRRHATSRRARRRRATIAGAIQAGDLVLVKGSRGIRTDVVADRIAAEFA